jgi:alkylated DNA repair protein alkB family protein 7
MRKHFATSVLSEMTTRRLTSNNNLLPEGFTFLSRFFDIREQRLLLTAALSQLDVAESIRVRRLQIHYRARRNPISDSAPVEGLFLPDHYYTFHQVST